MDFARSSNNATVYDSACEVVMRWVSCIIARTDVPLEMDEVAPECSLVAHCLNSVVRHGKRHHERRPLKFVKENLI